MFKKRRLFPLSLLLLAMLLASFVIAKRIEVQVEAAVGNELAAEGLSDHVRAIVDGTNVELRGPNRFSVDALEASAKANLADGLRFVATDVSVVPSGSTPTTSPEVNGSSTTEQASDSVKRLNSIVELDPIEFEPRSAVIEEASKSVLDGVAEVIDAVVGAHVVVIEGHTDSDGDEARNQSLSERRAKAVFDYLVSKGIDPSRLRYVGYGESRLKVQELTEADKQKNRRIEWALDGEEGDNE